MEYEAVVFDMDGVLLTGYHTDREVYREAVRETLAAFGRDAGGDPGADLPAGLVDPDGPAGVRRACEAHGLPPGPAWIYREGTATAIENRRIADGDRAPFPDAGALAELAGATRLGIASNNRRGTVRHVVRAFGWADLIDAAHGRTPTLEGFGRLKPDPHYLERALADLDAAGDEALYVGDRRTDVIAAARAGADAALLVRGSSDDGDGETASDPAPTPAYEIDSLSALPGIIG